MVMRPGPPWERRQLLRPRRCRACLYGWDDLAADAELPTVSQAPGFRGIAIAHNEPSEADVDRAYERFLAAGASFVKRPAVTDWGGYSGNVADLDGHLWELAYNPFDDWT